MSRKIKNAKIQSVRLGFDRGVFLCAWLHLDYGGGGQGFGGVVLDFKPGPDREREPSTLAGAWVTGILAALDVEAWEDLPGTSVRADCEHNKVYRVGHFLKEQWFDPEEVKQ